LSYGSDNAIDTLNGHDIVAYHVHHPVGTHS
jgi:hypothetical protein